MSTTSSLVVSKKLSLVVPDLVKLTSLLQCQICYDICSDAVMTQCSHNFCSVCIRHYLLKYKTSCPLCFQVTHENELLPNRVIDDIISGLSLLIHRLEEICVSNKFLKISEKNQSPPKNDDMDDSMGTKLSQPLPDYDTYSNSEISPSPHCSSPSCNVSIDQDLSEIFSECPVCLVMIQSKKIQCHVEKCLQYSSNQKKSAINIRRPNRNTFCKRMKPLVYHLMKDLELRKLCREVGLKADTKTGRKLLIARHQRFVVLWNSQCDKISSESQQDNVPNAQNICLQILREEEIINKEAIKSGNSKAVSADRILLNFDRNSSPETIAAKQKTYLKAHKSDFHKLVLAAKSSIERNDYSNRSGMIDSTSSWQKTPLICDEHLEVTSQVTSENSDQDACVITHIKDSLNRLKRRNSLSSNLSKNSFSTFGGNNHTRKTSTCFICSSNIDSSLFNVHVNKCIDKSCQPLEEIEDEDEEVSQSSSREITIGFPKWPQRKIDEIWKKDKKKEELFILASDTSTDDDIIS